MAKDDREPESSGESGGVTNGAVKSTLMSKELLIPAAVSAVGGLLASKGPDLMHKLTSATEQKSEDEAKELGERAADGAKDSLKNGSGGMMGKLAAKALGGGKGGGNGGKKTRRLPIQRWTDVAVPVDRAYEAWTEFEEWPNFMHRVLEAEPNEDEDNQIHVREKIWFWTREWDGEITEQKKNDRIAWKTT